MFLIPSNIHRFFCSFFFFFENTEVMAGNVGAINNSNLCYFNTINWDDIINEDSYQWKIYLFNGLKKNDCPPCDESCKTNSCWGGGLHNCQKFSKINCSRECNKRRCFEPRSGGCCHPLCAGGCTGPKQTDCLVNITALYIIFLFKFVCIIIIIIILHSYVYILTKTVCVLGKTLKKIIPHYMFLPATIK